MDVPHESLDACSPSSSHRSGASDLSWEKNMHIPPSYDDGGDDYDRPSHLERLRQLNDLVPDIHVAGDGIGDVDGLEESYRLPSAKELLDVPDIERADSRDVTEYGRPTEGAQDGSNGIFSSGLVASGLVSSGLDRGVDLWLTVRNRSAGLSKRKKKLLIAGACLLAVILGAVLLGSRDSSGSDAGSLRGGDPSAPKVTTKPPKHTDECMDDPTFVHANLKTCESFVAHVGRVPLHQARCAQSTGITWKRHGKEEVLVKHFCRKSCGECGDSQWVDMPEWQGWPEKTDEPEAAKPAATPAVEKPAEPAPVAEPPKPETEPLPETPATPAKPAAATPAVAAAPPNPADGCVDDPTFALGNGKTCETFVANVGRAELHKGRCGQLSGRVDGDGGSLLVKDFCIYSCGVCGDGKWAQHSEAPVEPVVAPPVEAAPVVEDPASAQAGCADDPTFVSVDGEGCAGLAPHAATWDILQNLCGQSSGRVDANGGALLVRDFCTLTCGACAGMDGVGAPPEASSAPELPESAPMEAALVAREPVAEAPVAEAPVVEQPALPAVPEPAAQTPAAKDPSSAAEPATPATPPAECADDPTFVGPDGKKCTGLAPLAAFPTFLQNLCGQSSGKVGANGNALLVSDFCMKSCGACSGMPAVAPAAETVPEAPAAPAQPESPMLASEETAVEEELAAAKPKPGHDSIEAWMDATFGTGAGGGNAP